MRTCLGVFVAEAAEEGPCGLLSVAVFPGVTVKILERHDRKWPQ